MIDIPCVVVGIRLLDKEAEVESIDKLGIQQELQSWP